MNRHLERREQLKRLSIDSGGVPVSQPPPTSPVHVRSVRQETELSFFSRMLRNSFFYLKMVVRYSLLLHQLYLEGITQDLYCHVVSLDCCWCAFPIQFHVSVCPKLFCLLIQCIPQMWLPQLTLAIHSVLLFIPSGMKILHFLHFPRKKPLTSRPFNRKKMSNVLRSVWMNYFSIILEGKKVGKYQCCSKVQA